MNTVLDRSARTFELDRPLMLVAALMAGTAVEVLVPRVPALRDARPRLRVAARAVIASAALAVCLTWQALAGVPVTAAPVFLDRSRHDQGGCTSWGQVLLAMS